MFLKVHVFDLRTQIQQRDRDRANEVGTDLITMYRLNSLSF